MQFDQSGVYIAGCVTDSILPKQQLRFRSDEYDMTLMIQPTKQTWHMLREECYLLYTTLISVHE